MGGGGDVAAATEGVPMTEEESRADACFVQV